MRGAKTSQRRHASLVGIALALTFTATVLRAQLAQQQEPSPPTQPQAQPSPAKLPEAQQEPSPPAQPQAQPSPPNLPEAQEEPSPPIQPEEQPPAQQSRTQQAPHEVETLHALVRRPLLVSSPGGIKRISVADPSIIDTVLVGPNQVLINGKSPGGVSLVVWDEKGQSQEFDINVDRDTHGLADQLHEALPEQPVRAEVQKEEVVWLVWIVIASIILLAGGILGARWQRGPRLNKLDLQARTKDSTEDYKEPEATVARHEARAEEHSVEEASTDGVTGVMTQRYFMEALDGEWRRSTRTGRQFCLAVVDLDKFKQVIDRVGHREGDKVLRAAAGVLEAQSRQPCVVARYRGDEFAILMPETTTQQAEIVAERLRAALEAEDFLRAHEVTASIGIATFPSHGRTPEEILRVADSGVRLAKEGGGNRMKVASLSPTIMDAERNERLLEAYLETAVKEMFSTTPDTFSLDQRKLEPVKPLLNTITALAFAVEARGPYVKGHSQAVSRLAARIAIQAGLTQAEVEDIRLAGLVHDIGRLHVPESVYNKPDLLTAEECQIMRSHAAWGAKMLEPLNVKAIERIVRHHHERYDGKGYPDGLAGDTIPLGARIVAVAECFHNMVSDLPYKTACTFEDALDELRRCSGMQFDPKVVMAFLEWLQTHNGVHNQPQQGEHHSAQGPSFNAAAELA